MIRIFIFVISFMIVNGLYEGDYCIFTRTNTAGTCIPLPNCKTALNDLRYRRTPQTCGFGEGGVALVCCTDTGPPGRIRSTTTSTTTPTYEDSGEEIQECAYPPDAITADKNEYTFKSWKKCIELADSVYPCAQRSFGIGAKKNRVSVCEHEAAELIIGGTPAKPNEFPHMAALGFADPERNNTIVWDCGGTLISERWIVSAAHCLFNKNLNADVSKARLGEIFLKNAGDPKNLFEIVEKVKHPDYVGTRVYNDITLLKIDRPVTYSNRILPACLHVGNDIKDNKAIATGYGLTSLDVASKSEELLKVTVHKFTKEECSSKYKISRKSPQGIIDTQICYGSKDEKKDTCQGDSGGPLQIYNNGVHCTYTIIGITSVGKLCATPGVPGVYTRISSYVPWIESVVWPN